MAGRAGHRPGQHLHSRGFRTTKAAWQTPLPGTGRPALPSDDATPWPPKRQPEEDGGVGEAQSRRRPGPVGRRRRQCPTPAADHALCDTPTFSATTVWFQPPGPGPCAARRLAGVLAAHAPTSRTALDTRIGTAARTDDAHRQAGGEAVAMYAASSRQQGQAAVLVVGAATALGRRRGQEDVEVPGPTVAARALCPGARPWMGRFQSSVTGRSQLLERDAHQAPGGGDGRVVVVHEWYSTMTARRSGPARLRGRAHFVRWGG